MLYCVKIDNSKKVLNKTFLDGIFIIKNVKSEFINLSKMIISLSSVENFI